MPSFSQQKTKHNAPITPVRPVLVNAWGVLPYRPIDHSAPDLRRNFPALDKLEVHAPPDRPQNVCDAPTCSPHTPTCRVRSPLRHRGPWVAGCFFPQKLPEHSHTAIRTDSRRQPSETELGSIQLMPALTLSTVLPLEFTNA